MVERERVDYRVAPGGALSGRLRVPGDKSISHRAVMLGALAEGETRVSGFLEGADALATLAAFRAMGVSVAGPDAGALSIQGVGLHGLQAPSAPLDMGNSGTSLRLLAGLLAGQAFDVTLTGDASLCRRPMGRVTEPLVAMGAQLEATATGTAPLTVRGGARLKGCRYQLPIASAQVKSALLLAGLYADGETCVLEPAPTRDHTERMLQGFGYAVTRGEGWSAVRGGGRLQATAIDVPTDISSAAFFLVGAAIAPGSDLLMEHVGINPTRTGILEVLRLMGADITLHDEREIGGEPVADIRVRASDLHGIQVPEHLVPLAIDEFPAVFVAAACARGRTVVTGAAELRVKESDRIAVMAEGLAAMGIDVEPTADGMVIQGGDLDSATVDSHGDHRIAMAFAMAALASRGPVTVTDCHNVATSFPGFVDLARSAGLDVTARMAGGAV